MQVNLFGTCTSIALAGAVGLISLLTSTPVFAENAEMQVSVAAPPTKSSNVLVHVRTIKASDVLSRHSDDVLESEATPQPLEVDERLADLSSKFESLNFRNFKLISSEELSIPLMKKERVALTEKTVLILRPIYLEDKRLGIWIKWTDKSERRVLLDTRMHFDSEESLLAGTDSKDNCGLILAISAKPEN